MKASSFLVNWVRGAVMKAYSLANILHHPVNPRNPRTSETLRGIGHLTMASTLAGSGEIPSLETTNPRYATLSTKKVHLLFFAYSLASLMITRTCRR